LGVTEANYVAGAAAICFQGSESVFDAVLAEIFEEGIACAQRKKTQRGPIVIFGGCGREQSVDDFEGCAVTAYGQEIARSCGVGLARDFWLRRRGRCA
jgi:hypothetical protein